MKWGDFTFTPKLGAEGIRGLHLLLGLSSFIVLGIGFLALCFYPIHGKKLEKNLRKRAKLHSEKAMVNQKVIELPLIKARIEHSTKKRASYSLL